MATPATAGIAALIRDFLTGKHHEKTSSAGYSASQYNETNPSSALVKALLIGSTEALSYAYQSNGDLISLSAFYSATDPTVDKSAGYALGTGGSVDFTQGFGHVRLSNVFSVDSSFDTFLYEPTLREYSSWARVYTVTSANTEIDITLAWADPPSALWCGYFYELAGDDGCLVHDLDLEVTHKGTRLFPNFGAASAGTYSGLVDTLNNVEKITIATSSLTVGDTILVKVVANGLSYAASQRAAVVLTGNVDVSDAPSSSPTISVEPTLLPTVPAVLSDDVTTCSEAVCSTAVYTALYSNGNPNTVCDLDYSCLERCSESYYAMVEYGCQCDQINAILSDDDDDDSYEDRLMSLQSFCCGTGACKKAAVQMMQSNPAMYFFSFSYSYELSPLYFEYYYEEIYCPYFSSYGIIDCGSPTAAPTLTTEDTVTVAVSMEMTSTAAPTSSDEDDLKTTIAASLELDEENIKEFTVTSTSSRRRRRRLFAIYTWVVSFTVSVSLADSTFASATEFSAGVLTALTSDAFVSAVSSAVGATVDTSSISVVLETRNPSSAPTPEPNNETNLKVIIVAVVGGLFGLVGSVLAVYFVYKRKKNTADGPAVEMTEAPVGAGPRVNPVLAYATPMTKVTYATAVL